ncbi:MAG: DUF4912 domain-containing protein [Clostridia bacterium]|nr:DUF4912 domain-containing protein [Clostridia bacterium]
MPRKAKEKIDENEKIIDEKKVVKKKTPAKKASSTKSSSKKAAEPKKKEVVKKEPTTKKTTTKSTVKKATAAKTPEKNSSTAKKATTRKSALAKIIENIDISDNKSNKTSTKKKSTSSKKVSAKKQTTKKTTTKKKTTKTDTQLNDTSIQIAEYYDLPYKYGNTVVKLLAQTPNTLFVYWEVSDDDIDNFKKIYGDDFFNKSTPILIVHNLTLNKTYEVEINDFANCWYLNTEDTDCKFDIELGRRFNESSYENDGNVEADYLYVAASNNLNSPNDHILFEKIKEFVVFRNVSNDNVIKKNVKSLKFLKDIYKFYKEMYDEDVLNNPSSQFKF